MTPYQCPELLQSPKLWWQRLCIKQQQTHKHTLSYSVRYRDYKRLQSPWLQWPDLRNELLLRSTYWISEQCTNSYRTKGQYQILHTYCICSHVAWVYLKFFFFFFKLLRGGAIFRYFNILSPILGMLDGCIATDTSCVLVQH